MTDISKTVNCRCKDTDCSGTFEVEGRFLILTSIFGVRKSSLGLQEPRKLAARLLKNLCLAQSSEPVVAARSLEAAELASGQPTV